jgi:hypothetical protein
VKRGYREALEKVGIRVLDVYRGREEDVLRVQYKGRVYLINLKRFYDTMKPEELVKAVISQIEGGS